MEQFIPRIHLMEEDRLRIRIGAVRVDSIPGGGGRAIFELFSTSYKNEVPALTIILEAPRFRAAAAGAIPEQNYAQVTAEAVERLREDLQVMLMSLKGMENDVLLRWPHLPIPIPEIDQEE